MAGNWRFLSAQTALSPFSEAQDPCQAQRQCHLSFHGTNNTLIVRLSAGEKHCFQKLKAKETHLEEYKWELWCVRPELGRLGLGLGFVLAVAAFSSVRDQTQGLAHVKTITLFTTELYNFLSKGSLRVKIVLISAEPFPTNLHSLSTKHSQWLHWQYSQFCNQETKLQSDRVAV